MSDYEKLNWSNGEAPALSEENLNHMDEGIAEAHEKIDDLDTKKLDKDAKGAIAPEQLDRVYVEYNAVMVSDYDVLNSLMTGMTSDDLARKIFRITFLPQFPDYRLLDNHRCIGVYSNDALLITSCSGSMYTYSNGSNSLVKVTNTAQTDIFLSNYTVAIDTDGKIIWFSDATRFANNAGYMCTNIPDAYSKDFILILGKNVEEIDEAAFVSSKAKEVYTYSQEIKDSVTSLGVYGVLPELVDSYDYTSALMKTLLLDDVVNKIDEGSITDKMLEDDYIQYSGSYDIETIDDLRALTNILTVSVDEFWNYDFSKSVIVKCNFIGDLASEYGECEHIGILTSAHGGFLGSDTTPDCWYNYLLLVNPATGTILSYVRDANSIHNITNEYANKNEVWYFAQLSIESYEELNEAIKYSSSHNPHKAIQKIHFNSNFPDYDLVGDEYFIGFTGEYLGANNKNLLLLSVDNGAMLTYTYGSGQLIKVQSETSSGNFWEIFNRHGASLDTFQEYVDSGEYGYGIGLWEFILDGFNNNEVCTCFVFPDLNNLGLMFLDIKNGSLYRYDFNTNTMETISVGVTQEQVEQIELNKTDIENLNTTLGNIETALDSIIAIQEEIIGGSE